MKIKNSIDINFNEDTFKPVLSNANNQYELLMYQAIFALFWWWKPNFINYSSLKQTPVLFELNHQLFTWCGHMKNVFRFNAPSCFLSSLFLGRIHFSGQTRDNKKDRDEKEKHSSNRLPNWGNIKWTRITFSFGLLFGLLSVPSILHWKSHKHGTQLQRKQYRWCLFFSRRIKNCVTLSLLTLCLHPSRISYGFSHFVGMFPFHCSHLNGWFGTLFYFFASTTTLCRLLGFINHFYDSQQ